MNKQNIITALLALVALAGQAKKTVVWENPSVAYSAIPYFQIQKVEMSCERGTVLCSFGLTYIMFSMYLLLTLYLD